VPQGEDGEEEAGVSVLQYAHRIGGFLCRFLSLL
jgi:hypothetical protein